MDINNIALILAKGDTEQAEIKAYYIKNIIHTGITLISTLTASYLLNVFNYALIIILTLQLLRTKTGGCHSRSVTLCKFISFFSILGLAELTPIITISDQLLLIWFAFVLLFGLYTIHKVVPLESPQRPIISMKFRKQLKIKAYIFFLVLMTNIYIFRYYGYFEASIAVLLALSLQLFLMTRLGYLTFEKIDSILLCQGGMT